MTTTGTLYQQSVGCLVESCITECKQAIWFMISYKNRCYFALSDVSSLKLLKYDLKLLQNMNISLNILLNWSWMKLDLNLLWFEMWYFHNFNWHQAGDLLFKNRHWHSPWGLHPVSYLKAHSFGTSFMLSVKWKYFMDNHYRLVNILLPGPCNLWQYSTAYGQPEN